MTLKLTLEKNLEVSLRLTPLMYNRFFYKQASFVSQTVLKKMLGNLKEHLNFEEENPFKQISPIKDTNQKSNDDDNDDDQSKCKLQKKMQHLDGAHFA